MQEPGEDVFLLASTTRPKRVGPCFVPDSWGPTKWAACPYRVSLRVPLPPVGSTRPFQVCQFNGEAGKRGKYKRKRSSERRTCPIWGKEGPEDLLQPHLPQPQTPCLRDVRPWEPS